MSEKTQQFFQLLPLNIDVYLSSVWLIINRDDINPRQIAGIDIVDKFNYLVSIISKRVHLKILNYVWLLLEQLWKIS